MKKFYAIQKIGSPIHTYLQEVHALARFIEEYWNPDPERKLPGLSQVQAELPYSTAAELRELAHQLREADAATRFEPAPDFDRRAEMAKADALRRELEAALRFALKDGELASSYAEARRRLRGGRSVAAMAQRLNDYAGIAERLGPAAEAIEPGLLEECRRTARILLENQLGPGRRASRSVAVRDRLLELLHERVTRARAAARYVFRKHPAIARRATSPHQRTRRAAAREAPKTPQRSRRRSLLAG